MPRVIYSLEFDLRSIDGKVWKMIVPLDANGQHTHNHAIPPKQRIIDLRVGDWMRTPGGVGEIVSVRAYRDAFWQDGVQLPSDGYAVRERQAGADGSDKG